MPAALPPDVRSCDDLATPLAEVTFAVVDLETTGGAPDACGITEVGALKLRGGECLGTYQTLVNPGAPIPAFVRALTGITDAMVVPAPRVEEMLPSLLEFLRGSVIVGHNVRYDLAFLDAALAAHGYPRLAAHRHVDTLAVARRLVRGETTDLRLATLAHHLRVPTTPTHRALDDARATGEVLHALLERAATLGVLGLDDLLDLPRIRAHPSAHKLKLTARLPRDRGVFVFRDRQHRVVYVGRAANLRRRVRHYFAGDRRGVPPLVRETEAIDHVVCAHPLEAAVRQLRLVREHEPRFNRQPRAWQRYSYVQVAARPHRKPTVVPRPRGDASSIGPFPSSRIARLVRDALASSIAPGELAAAVEAAGRSDGDGDGAGAGAGIVGLVERRLARSVASEHFEQAARLRDGLAGLRGAIARQRLLNRARGLGRVAVDGLEIDHGRLVLSGDAGAAATPGPAVAREEIDELLTVAQWLAARSLPTAPAAATARAAGS